MFYIVYGAGLLVLAGYIYLSARLLRRTRPSIDLTNLTVDEPVTYTVDPTLFTNAEWQSLHRAMAEDQASMRYAVSNPFPPYTGDCE